MKLTIEIDGNVRAIYGSSAAHGKKAITGAVGAAGAGLKENWRSQIGTAGLGTRVQRTVRNKTYPASTTSFHPASLVWSKAGNIVSSFEQGSLIRSPNGFYLAIPIGNQGRGMGGKRITPGLWEAKTGRRLRFVYRPGRPALLVDDGTVAKRAPRAAFGERQREYRGFKNKTVPIFILVPQVKMPKLLNLMSAGQQAISSLPERIVAAWRDQ